MDDKNLMKVVQKYIQEICHYSQMQVFATSVYQKRFFQLQIDEEVLRMVDFLMNNTPAISDIHHIQTEMPLGDPVQQERTFTKEELANNNGIDGKPAYVAVNGIVYDVTPLFPWAGGDHFGLHAGRDLTKDFMVCHGGFMEQLKNASIIGKLLT